MAPPRRNRTTVPETEAGRDALAARVAAGDPDAFATFRALIVPAVLAIAAGHGLSREDREDVCQVTFWNFSRRLGRLQGATWRFLVGRVRCIARRRSIDQVCRLSKLRDRGLAGGRPAPSTFAYKLGAKRASVEADAEQVTRTVEQEELKEQVFNLLAELPASRETALRLWLKSQSFEEIGLAMGFSKERARQLVGDAVARLREALADQE